MSDKCVVCNLDVTRPESSSSLGTRIYRYSCRRCGDYSIEHSFRHDLPRILNGEENRIAVLSHWIRTQHESKPPPDERGGEVVITLDRDLVETVINQPPPNPAEQADNFVRWIGDNAKSGGRYIPVNQYSILAIIGSTTVDGYHLVFSHLRDEKGTILSKTHVGGGDVILADVTLSVSGWEYYEELKRGAIDTRKAFMAMEYDVKELDKVVEEVFKPAVKQTGFDLFKLVDRPKAGLIDDRLRVEIQTSRFLIADLTHENAGAYWEAGYAEGLGKPVIYTCEKAKFEEQKTHFDTNHHLTVTWDPKKPEEAAEELKATIRAALPGEAKLTDE